MVIQAKIGRVAVVTGKDWTSNVYLSKLHRLRKLLRKLRFGVLMRWSNVVRPVEIVFPVIWGKAGLPISGG